MPYNPKYQQAICPICGSRANGFEVEFGYPQIVNCTRCGDFEISHIVASDIGLPWTDARRIALASHTIRKMQSPKQWATLRQNFFDALNAQTLPTPAEAGDNLLRWIAEQTQGRPGIFVDVLHASPDVLGFVGVIGAEDISWLVTYLRLEKGFIYSDVDMSPVVVSNLVQLTGKGWDRINELQMAHVASTYAFFARKFDNSDLDRAVELCIRQAVKDTGYDLRTVTQRAGLIDAIIEDEIRRCRFLIADLSDDNAGAYWEAGFAEGLGKPVVYLCKAKDGAAEKKTHFDADHRHTVRWDLTSLEQTAANLKAVIRNTLLGDAK
jgi:hypothetical protein